MVRNGYDDVNGIVIGDIETKARYRFISTKTGMPQGRDMHFENDNQAIEYARVNFPDAWKTGIEMRVFD